MSIFGGSNKGKDSSNKKDAVTDPRPVYYGNPQNADLGRFKLPNWSPTPVPDSMISTSMKTNTKKNSLRPGAIK